jgi:hypothetical protein
MFIKSCEPPPVYQISTIGRLEICTSASAAKGNVEKAYLQKMLVMHITVYHHLQDGGRNGVGRAPKEPREGFAISESTSLLTAFGGKARLGLARELYICPFKSPISPEMFLPSSQRFVVPLSKSTGHNDFEAPELNTHAGDTQPPTVPQTRYWMPSS